MGVVVRRSLFFLSVAAFLLLGLKFWYRHEQTPKKGCVCFFLFFCVCSFVPCDEALFDGPGALGVYGTYVRKLNIVRATCYLQQQAESIVYMPVNRFGLKLYVPVCIFMSTLTRLISAYFRVGNGGHYNGPLPLLLKWQNDDDNMNSAIFPFF